MCGLSTVEERVRDCLVELLACRPEDVTREAHFENDLGADKKNEDDWADVIGSFEHEFDISISDEEADEMTTVGYAITLIEKRIKR